ncbi:uncharacterized protein T551_01869 [Pneumocystis jirovecii RU7]|uniref:Uncharacterized protein n=1 Tax=Pneumocystis jirovecii (strain RU7) TaxID=1408657 RepID=A0A0W4ZNH1_PNEJ7|nr:uncharacterized protein T551_01869 [Pneumocystis jirovecii RU7]KTW29925.1 hypothetical protein T551_01869 [Pneumocystis jirovecii RU7]
MGSISEPYFLAKLPHPINSNFTKQYYIAKVFPETYQEIIVAINEIGINIYSASSGQIIANYPVDRNTQFSCAPISTHTGINKERITIVGSIEAFTRIPKLLLWNEKPSLDGLQFKFTNTKSKIINIQLLKNCIIAFLESGELIQYSFTLNVIYETVTSIPNMIGCGQIKNLSNGNFSTKSDQKNIIYKISIENLRILIIDIFQIRETTCKKLNTIGGILTKDFDTTHKITLTEKNIIYHLTPTHLFTYILTSSSIKFRSKTEFTEDLSAPIFLEIIHNYHIIICSTNKILLFDTTHQIFFFSREITPINTAPVIIHTSESPRIQNALLVLSDTKFLILSSISSSKKSLLIDMFAKTNSKGRTNYITINSITDFEKKENNKLILESPLRIKKHLNKQKKLVKTFLIKLRKYSLLKDGNKFDNIFFKYFDTKNLTNKLYNNDFNKENKYDKLYIQNKKIRLSPQILDKIIQIIFIPLKKNIYNSNKISKLETLFYPKKTLNYLTKTVPLLLTKEEYSDLINAIIRIDSSLLLNLFLNSDLLPPRELTSILKYVLNNNPINLKIFRKILKTMDNYIGEQIVLALKKGLTKNEIEKLINLLGKQISLKKRHKKFKRTSYISNKLVIYRMLENSLDTIGISGITIQNTSLSFFNTIYNTVKETITEIIDLNNTVNILDELIRRAGGHKNINQKYQEFKSSKLNKNNTIDNLKKRSSPQLRNTLLSNQLSISTLQEIHLKTKRAKGYQKNFSVEKYSIEKLEL